MNAAFWTLSGHRMSLYASLAAESQIEDMYTQFFRLNQAPFSIAPDPRYLFMSERHREALAHLLYGINSGGGFVLLTGEIGAGKTTVCRCFLEQIPRNCRVAYIFNPKLTVNELLGSICDEFGVRVPKASDTASVKDYVDELNAYLLASHAGGRNNVLIIDEAQNLSIEVLEQLRLLTNLETSERKLLQIILIGQPELRTILAKPELEQLAQRVIARYHLDSLSVPETTRYVLHRLAIAGMTSTSPFPAQLMPLIHQITRGVPRRINLLCDRALLGAYAETKPAVDRAILKKAAIEVFGRDALPGKNASAMRYVLLGLLGGIAVSGAAAWLLSGQLRGLPSGSNKNVTAVQPSSAGRPPVPTQQAAPLKTEPKDLAAPAPLPAPSPAPPSGSQSGAASASAVLSAPPAASAPPPAITPAAAALEVPIPAEGVASDEGAAFRQLAQFWNVTLPEGDSCTAAQKISLRCYKSNAGLAELRLLDRPAILILRDDADKPFYALLTALDSSSASLRIGSATQRFNLSALGRRFRGEFMTFWRTPPGYRENIGIGDRGTHIDWLATQLALKNGARHISANQPFDQALARSVRDFQAARGLKADGAPGPRTFMSLNVDAGVGEPHLQATAMNAMRPANPSSLSGK